eukprot:GFUD01085184.1.p1 GENE.GFUD01085184.1~~GFUD01085184.1.p1  ORF type:complete len:617 (-),score=91.06 GFUD01085184.1:222-2072(-)
MNVLANNTFWLCVFIASTNKQLCVESEQVSTDYTQQLDTRTTVSDDGVQIQIHRDDSYTGDGKSVGQILQDKVIIYYKGISESRSYSRPIVNNDYVIDITWGVCYPRITEVSVGIQDINQNNRNFNLDSSLFSGKPTFQCSLYPGGVRFTYDGIQQYCVRYLKVTEGEKKQEKTISHVPNRDIFTIEEDTCNGPAKYDFEISYNYHGFRQTCHAERQEIKLVKQKNQLVLEHNMVGCIKNVVISDKENISTRLTCKMDNINKSKYVCEMPKSCSAQTFSIHVDFGQKSVSAGSFESNIIAGVSLVYHKQSETVVVEGDQGSLACAGNILEINLVAGTVDKKSGKVCSVGIFFTGDETKTITKSSSECRKKCQDAGDCNYWAFFRSNCELYKQRPTSGSSNNTEYVSGHKLCTLPEDNISWDIENSSKQFSLSPYIYSCKEAVLLAVYEGLDKDDVHKLTIEHTPRMNLTLNETHFIINIENEDFKKCDDLKFELQCKSENEIYRSFLNFTQRIVNLEHYQGVGCRVRAWMDENFLPQAKFEYIGTAKEDNIGLALILGITVPVVIISLIMVSCVVVIVRRKNAWEDNPIPDIPMEVRRRETLRYENDIDDEYYSVL